MQKTKIFRKLMGAVLCAGMLVGLAGSMSVTAQAALKTVNISTNIHLRLWMAVKRMISAQKWQPFYTILANHRYAQKMHPGIGISQDMQQLVRRLQKRSFAALNFLQKKRGSFWNWSDTMG